MDEKMFEAVDKFLDEIVSKGKSDVVCPKCKTPLKIEYYSSSYVVSCQSENCLREGFRGL